MKIAFIASRNISELGGIENYMANLCPFLVEKGYEVILYTEGQKNKITYYKGVKIIELKSIKNRFLNKIILGLKATLNVLFKQKNVDIIHYNAMAAGLSSSIPLVLGKKVIFQLHGLEWQRKKWGVSSKFIIKLLETFVLRINKNIIAVSQEQTNYVKQKFNKNCTSIFPGANLPNTITETDILKQFNLQKNKYILFLGRLVEEKRPDLLMQAFNNLNNNDIKLVIAGDDIYSKNYIKYLHSISTKSIIFTGAVYNKDKDTLLNNCLLFCSPSELEGLPITLLEAMSFKKICLVSNILAHKETLEENGIYFKNGDVKDLQNKLKLVIENTDKYTYIGEENYNRIKHNFTWNIIADKYEEYLIKITK